MAERVGYFQRLGYFSANLYRAFSHTDMWFWLSLVKGARRQSLQRSRSVIPASCAMRSNSEGQT
jgi:hypothetical protein